MNIQDQGKKWFKSLNDIFQQSFKKVRVTAFQKETTISKLFDKRLKLKQKLKVPNQSDNDEENIGNQIEDIETIISKEVSKDLRDKIVKNFETLTNTDGTQNVNGMWTLTKS